MARVNIPVKVAAMDQAAGVDMTVGAVAPDDSNEHKLFNRGGRVVLLVRTESTSGVSLTFVSVADPYGRTGDLGPTAVGASKLFAFGPFTPLLFNQSSGADLDYIYINAASITGTVAMQGLQV